MCVYVEDSVLLFCLLLHHATFVVHVDRYCGLGVLDGLFDQRSFNGQQPLRRQGGGHLLNISVRGEATREK